MVALWSKLEQWSAAEQRRDASRDPFRQGIFVLVCVFVAIAIDQFLLEAAVLTISPDWLPLAFYQVVLLPVVFVVGAYLLGPSKEIRITRPGRGTRP